MVAVGVTVGDHKVIEDKITIVVEDVTRVWLLK